MCVCPHNSSLDANVLDFRTPLANHHSLLRLLRYHDGRVQHRFRLALLEAIQQHFARIRNLNSNLTKCDRIHINQHTHANTNIHTRDILLDLITGTPLNIAISKLDILDDGEARDTDSSIVGKVSLKSFDKPVVSAVQGLASREIDWKITPWGAISEGVTVIYLMWEGNSHTGTVLVVFTHVNQNYRIFTDIASTFCASAASLCGWVESKIRTAHIRG